MHTQRIEKIYKLDKNYLELLERNQVHIITLAYLGLNFSHEYIKLAIKDSSLRYDLIANVCRLKETGTLYPHKNLTLIPVEYLYYPVMGGETISKTEYSEAVCKKFIKDAFEAEIKHIKSNFMVFDFRDKTIQLCGKYILDLRLYQLTENLISEEYANFNIKYEFLLER